MEGAFKIAAEATKAKAYTLSPTVAQSADSVTVTFSLADIAKSRSSAGKKASVGFLCNPIEFSVDGQKFALKPGWVSLEAR